MIPNNKIENNNIRSKANILPIIEKGECSVFLLYCIIRFLLFDLDKSFCSGGVPGLS